MCKQVSYSPTLQFKGVATQVQGPGDVAYQLRDFSPMPVVGRDCMKVNAVIASIPGSLVSRWRAKVIL